jgi:hypothetical protein
LFQHVDIRQRRHRGSPGSLYLYRLSSHFLHAVVYPAIMVYLRLFGLSLLTLVQCISALISSASAASFQSTCAAFAKSIKIPNVTVNFVEHIANGTNVTFPDNVCYVLASALAA